MHEARHIWQYRTEMNEDDREEDADGYTWPTLVESGFTEGEIRRERQELAKRAPRAGGGAA